MKPLDSHKAEENIVSGNLPDTAAILMSASTGITVTLDYGNNPVSAESDNSRLYRRYYHIFREGELEGLCGSIKDGDIVNSYYDQGNCSTTMIHVEFYVHSQLSNLGVVLKRK